MTNSTRIDDPRFDRIVSLRDSYKIMCRFLAAYHARGESPTGDLIGDTSLLEDGSTLDPAQLDDFLAAASETDGC